MMVNFVKKKNEKGFTLVELAIVLVIIGLILAGIIKGQELIANAKIKRTYNVQKEIAAAIYTYFDRYQFYPGDDPQAVAKFPGSGVLNGNGNGLIDNGAGIGGAVDFSCITTGNGSEPCNMWAELRQSGILTGSGFTNPTHPYGGGIGVSYWTAPAVGGGTSVAQTTHWIHFQNVPYDVCQLIDQQFDDGNFGAAGNKGAGTGSIRSGTAGVDYYAVTTGTVQLEFKL